ncbi:MAG: glutathione S-transferase [SAR86 cluster bacterium]|uniref:Glutathione S-transferase n=1 Tax=SAR86 cluster bacterium TaxID=2030880 RepID=A0A2A4WZT6_9GAMM|nr:MAG: glutathione S-transferase [SAR86 cluster bacterium]
MNEPHITLWGAGTSRTIRPIWVAEELGLSYALKPIGPRTGETRTETYTQLNPKQKIPFLEDGGLQLSESFAICRYLVNRYGSTATIAPPASVEEQAKQDEWLSFIYGELDETSLYILRRHEALASIYGEAPTAIAAAKEYFQKQVAVADKHLRDNQFLVNNKFGVADIFLTTCLGWAESCGIGLSDNLKSYQKRMLARPGYQAAKAQNTQQL